MATNIQKDKAIAFRQMHQEAQQNRQPLVLPNAWDAASAAIFYKAGLRAIATTSSGIAAAYGYPDGERISQRHMLQAIEKIAFSVDCPVTADIESGFGANIRDVLETIQAVISMGAVGINIEDSTKHGKRTLVDVSYQVELLKAIQELGQSLDVPLVINARTDVFLLPASNATHHVEQAARRLNTYRQAGADCLFPIGVGDADTIAKLVQAVSGPINILAGPGTPSLMDLAQLGVARVSFGSGPMRAALGRIQRIAQELLIQGTYSTMFEEAISGAELRSLFQE